MQFFGMFAVVTVKSDTDDEQCGDDEPDAENGNHKTALRGLLGIRCEIALDGHLIGSKGGKGFEEDSEQDGPTAKLQRHGRGPVDQHVGAI